MECQVSKWWPSHWEAWSNWSITWSSNWLELGMMWALSCPINSANTVNTQLLCFKLKAQFTGSQGSKSRTERAICSSCSRSWMRTRRLSRTGIDTIHYCWRRNVISTLLFIIWVFLRRYGEGIGNPMNMHMLYVHIILIGRNVLFEQVGDKGSI